MKVVVLVSLAMLYLVSETSAQTVKVDHHSKSELEQTANALRVKAAAGSGSAATTLEDYGPDKTMVSVRTQSGGAEIHAEYADFFVILEGHATLLNGGTIVEPVTKSPGEVLGKGLENAARVELSSGDVVHIPPGVPHQLQLSPGETFKYFVIKVKEAPGAAAK